MKNKVKVNLTKRCFEIIEFVSDAYAENTKTKTKDIPFRLVVSGDDDIFKLSSFKFIVSDWYFLIISQCVDYLASVHEQLSGHITCEIFDLNESVFPLSYRSQLNVDFQEVTIRVADDKKRFVIQTRKNEIHVP